MARTAREKWVFRYSARPAAYVLGTGAVLFLVACLVQGKVSGLGAAATFAVCGPIGAYFLSLRMRVRLVIDEQGVLFVDRGRSTAVPWQDIHAVGSSVVEGDIREYRLLKFGEPVLTWMNEVEDAEHAYRTIERRIGLTLYPWYRDRIERGEIVDFGPAALGQNFVRVGGVSSTLERSRLEHAQRELRLVERGTGEVLAAVEEGVVPNLGILLRIAAELDPASQTSKMRRVVVPRPAAARG